MRPRLRAEALMIRREMECIHVLVQCDAAESFYRFPGGSIETGETASTTIVRELLEEFDLHVRVGNLAMVREEQSTYGGQVHHQVTLVHWAEIAEPVSVVEVRWHHEHAEVKLVWRSVTALQQKTGAVSQGMLHLLTHPEEPVVHVIQGFVST